jgi:hypothetical protein
MEYPSNLAKMEPPKVDRHSVHLAVFWFLAWHQAEFRQPYTFGTQAEFAAAAGVSPSVISDLIRIYKPSWLRVNARQAQLSTEATTPNPDAGNDDGAGA